MPQRAHVRHAAVAVVAAAALVAPLALVATPAAADPAGTVGTAEARQAGSLSFPLNPRKQPRTEEVWNVGPTGFLHGSERHSSISGHASVWTEYATGKSVELVSEGGGSGPGAGYPGAAGEGSDVVAFQGVGGDSENVDLKDMTTGKVTRIEVPDGDINQGVFGSAVLVQDYKGEDPARATGYYLLRPQGEEAVARTEVTGWPEGSVFTSVQVLGGDAESVVLSFSTTPDQYDEPDRVGVVDLDTGGLRSVAGHSALGLALDPEHIGWWEYRDRKLHVRDRDDLDAAARLVTVPEDLDPQYAMFLGGDWMVAPQKESGDYSLGRELVAFTLDGTRRTVLLDNADRHTDQFPGGGAFALGGDSAEAWFAHRITVEDGEPAVRKLTRIDPMNARADGIAVAGGSVTTVENTGVKAASGFYRRDLAPLGEPETAGEPTWLGRESGRYDYTSCGQRACEYVFASGDGRVVYPVRSSRIELVARGGGDAVSRVNTGAFEGQIVDVFGRYAAFTSGRPSYPGDPDVDGELIVADFDAPAGSGIVLRKPYSAATIWGSTLYTSTGTSGEVELTDLETGKKTGTLQTGATCAIVDLQTAGRWLSWSCPGFGASGAVERKTGAKVTLPRGQGLLGDGYFVSTPSWNFAVTTFQDGTPETRHLEERPAWNGGHAMRRYSWSVDRFGGGLAYLDDERNGKVLPSPVAPSDLAALPTGVPGTLTTVDGDSWQPRWQLSRPASSWELTVRDQAGKQVHRVTSGATRGPVRAAWDGKGPDGRTVAAGAYTWTLTVAPANGAGPAAKATGTLTVTAPQPQLTGTFEPVQPARLMDTRSGLGAPKAQVGPKKTVTLQVAGKGGVPASGVTAVVLNVTATKASAASYVSVYPAGTERTAASNLNVAAGVTAPNLVVVPVKDGKVTFYNNAGSLDLIADVSGYYTSGGDGSTFEPVQPARLMDTRSGLGAPKAQVGPKKTVTLQVAGKGGVPASGVTAVVLNVTATKASAASYVSVYPAGTERTAASNLNVAAGKTRPNLVVVPVKDGKVTFYNNAGSVDLIADVSGYYTEARTGSTFEPVQPARLMDTRSGLGAPKAQVGPKKTVTLQVAGKGGVPASGVTAVVLNVTATKASAASYVSVYPAGTERTAASNLNVAAGVTVPNLVVVPVKDGKVTFYNNAGSLDLIADVSGYYTR